MYVYIYIYVTVGEDSVVVQASGERCSTYTCIDVYIYDNIYIYTAVRGYPRPGVLNMDCIVLNMETHNPYRWSQIKGNDQIIGDHKQLPR